MDIDLIAKLGGATAALMGFVMACILWHLLCKSSKSRLRLYEMNDCDTVAAYSKHEAIQFYKTMTGIEEPWETVSIIDDDILDELKLHDCESGEKLTYREVLKSMSEPGLFCSTEY